MFEFFMTNYAGELFQLLLLIAFGFIGFLFKRFMDNDTVIALAKIAVNCVEQVFIELKGPQKLEKALDTLAAMLKKKGIKLDREDMIVYLEAAVAEMNRVLKAPLKDAATADATRRIDQNADANEPSDTAYSNGVNSGTM